VQLLDRFRIRTALFVGVLVPICLYVGGKTTELAHTHTHTQSVLFERLQRPTMTSQMTSQMGGANTWAGPPEQQQQTHLVELRPPTEWTPLMKVRVIPQCTSERDDIVRDHLTSDSHSDYALNSISRSDLTLAAQRQCTHL